jgi:hypothetical protein
MSCELEFHNSRVNELTAMLIVDHCGEYVVAEIGHTFVRFMLTQSPVASDLPRDLWAHFDADLPIVTDSEAGS